MVLLWSFKYQCGRNADAKNYKAKKSYYSRVSFSICFDIDQFSIKEMISFSASVQIC